MAPIRGPEGMIYVEGAFPSRAQAERTVLEAVREALRNVEGNYEIEFASNGHGASNPADHYAAGYKLGLKLKSKPGYKNWSWEGVKQALENKVWTYGHRQTEVSAGNEYLQGIEDAWYEHAPRFGIFTWIATGHYDQKSPVKTFDSETKSRRWLEANRDTLPPDPAGHGYVVRHAEAS